MPYTSSLSSSNDKFTFPVKIQLLEGVGYSLLLSQAGGPFCVSSEPDMLTASLRCTRGFSWLSVLDCSVKDSTRARPGSSSLRSLQTETGWC